MASINFLGRGQNVVGDIPFPAMVQDMPVTWANFDELNEGTKGCSRDATGSLDAMLTEGTWEFWIKQAIGGEYQNGTMFGKVGSWTVNGGAGRESGYNFNWRGIKSTAETTISTPAECTIPRGSAVHCCATYDGTTTKLYLNGSLVSSSTALSGVLDTSSNYLHFPMQGASSCPQGALWDGRLWDRVLPQSEIQYNFANRPTVTGALYDNTGLLGWYPLNGDADDISGNGFNLTESANVEYSAQGFNLKQIGSGAATEGGMTVTAGTWNLRDSSYATFNGSSDKITIARISDDLELPDRFSWCAWFNTASVDSADNGIMSMNVAGVYLDINNTTEIRFRVNDVAYVTTPYDHATDGNKWHHVVGTYDKDAGADQLKLYLDGVLVDTETYSSAITYAGNDLFIGWEDWKGADGYFDGDIFDCRIVAYAMCAEEVAAMYSGWADPAAIGWWIGIGESKAVQATDSTTIPDMGNANNDGTMSSNLWVNPTYYAGPGADDPEGDTGPISYLNLAVTGTELSAPRGTFKTTLAMAAGASNVGTYTHNDGMFAFTPGYYNTEYTGSSQVFYDMIVSGQVGMEMRLRGDWTVENSLEFKGANNVEFNCSQGPVYLYLGSGCSVVNSTTEALRGDNLNANGLFISGTNYLYPAVFTGDDWDWDSSYGTAADKGWQLGNIDYRPTTLNTDNAGAGNQIIKQIGRFQCNNLHLKSEDEWDTNGHDLITSGTLTVEGIFTGGSGLHNINNINANFSGADLTLSSGITYINGGGSSALSLTSAMSNLSFASGTLVFNQSDGSQRFEFNKTPGSNAKRMGTVVFNNGPDNYSYISAVGWTPGTYRVPHDDIIILSNTSSTGVLTQGLDMGMDGSLKIAADAKINASSSTLTLGENFNMAGGFIGKGALDLDGVDERVYIPDSTSLDDPHTADRLTLECWVTIGDIPNSIDVAMIGRDSQYRFYLENAPQNTIRMQLLMDGDWQTIDSNTPYTSLVQDKWHHLATTWDGSTLKLYIDGKLDAEEARNGPMTASVAYLALGSYRHTAEMFWEGKMARASVWATALTEAEIRSMMFQDWSTMAAADVIDDSKCVGWYEFSDLQNSTTVSDMSGSGNTGTLQPDTDGWAGPGTFTYDESTLVFDNDGTLPDTSAQS